MEQNGAVMVVISVSGWAILLWKSGLHLEKQFQRNHHFLTVKMKYKRKAEGRKHGLHANLMLGIALSPLDIQSYLILITTL